MTELIVREDTGLPVWLGRSVLTHGKLKPEGHAQATHQVLAKRVAVLLDLPFAGACEDSPPIPPAYLVPSSTLCGREVAHRYGVKSEDDLLGGWVSRDWMATKAIMHPLVPSPEVIPPDWPAGMARDSLGLTLTGYTAFSAMDARKAAHILLENGPVRLKPASADGGRGQVVARNRSEFDSALECLCVAGRLSDIVIVEENLHRPVTFSVGQVRLAGRTISYCGTQAETRNNHGAAAYGGSSLIAVRGGYRSLLARPLPSDMRESVERAVAFDTLADLHLPGLIASRRNYDVICGQNTDSKGKIGVLEQSWRVGGATGAEIAALEVFARMPRAIAAQTRTVEAYGQGHLQELPDGATIYYRGNEPELGPLLKYACVDEIIEGE